MSASLALNSNLLQGTGSTGFATTASLTAVSSSQQQISASLLNVVANYATTGSNSFRANQSITGSLVVSSTITAQTLVVQTVTSSIVYSSGSNIFGSALTDRQTFTGSVNITGSSHAIFGNVGIGIASPAEKIHVFGSSAATSPRILIQSHDTANATAGLTLYGRDVSNVNKVSEIVTSGSDLTISVNSLERMRINSSGFVGIGTTNPTGSLDVSGSVYIRSTSGGVLYIPRMADQSRGLSIGEQTALGSKSATIRTAGGVSEHLFLDPGFNNSDVAGNIALAYANTGSVGIGTYLPSAKLHVVGLTGGASGGATGIPSLGFANSSSIALFTNKDTAYGTLFGTLNTGVGWIQQQRVDGTATAYSLSLQPNGGNVGIGTNSPSQILDLQSAAAVLKMKSTTGINQVYTNYENSAGNFYVGRDNSTAGSFGGSAYAALLYASGPYPMEFWTNSSRKMVITSDGYVAIGNTSPVSRLTVNNSVAGATLPYINGTGLSYNSEGISVAGSNTNNTNIGNGLTLYNNVASVGAYSPVIAFSSMTPGGAYNATYAFITGIYRGSGGDSNWSIGDLMFGTGAQYGAQERMRIRYDGNVGIGTTNPAKPLSVWPAGGIGVYSGNSYSPSISLDFNSGTNIGHLLADQNAYYIRTLTSYPIYVQANQANGVYLSVGSTSWTANSDERLKNITGNIENAIDSLLTLRAIKHTWKSDNTNKQHLALIAQDVEKVFPEVIDSLKLPSKVGEEQTDETEYLGVRYTELIPVLVKAIQELKAEFDTYKETHP
jgi:hypothetical protein